MWIDKIVEHVPEKSLTAIKVVSLSEEHMHDHFPANKNSHPFPIMPAPLMIEGMAQTSGLLIGSLNKFSNNVLLAKIRSALLTIDVLPGETIRYKTSIETLHNNGAATNGKISKQSSGCLSWEDVGNIDLVFSYGNKDLNTSLPKTNFVFDDNFGTMLYSLNNNVSRESEKT